MEDKGKLIPDHRVILWSHLRSCSTSFERSIRQLKNVKVVHEPHQGPYFLGPERSLQFSLPSSGVPLFPEASFKVAYDEMIQSYHGYDTVFIKDHAITIKGKFHKYIDGPFATFKHTFIIRNPVMALYSLNKAMIASSFNVAPSFSGYKELYEMYETVKAIDSNPIVIDSDDLLSDPKGMMQKYCKATGIQFDECMLQWNPADDVPERWKLHSNTFHAAVIKSSSFVKPPPCDEAKLLAEMPEEYREAVESNQVYYNALHSVRMQCSVD